MHHRTYAEGYIHARNDSLLVIQQELISMNEGAVAAEAAGDAERAEWCRSTATVLERINRAVADLQPPA